MSYYLKKEFMIVRAVAPDDDWRPPVLKGLAEPMDPHWSPLFD